MRTFILVCAFCSMYCYAQKNIPKDYFAHPLQIPLAISGTYGELRSNHFHSGLDIKTQGTEGIAVHAAATGTVSRIKIAHGGYGKAMYITHPNGYTTVYAHLQKFAPSIEAYVKKRQYAKESYEIELFPANGDLRVTKGDLIAYSGNTGGSGGPHLHFEIRDGRARPMNPLQFGMTIADTKQPIIEEVWLYNLENTLHGTAEKTQLRLTPVSTGQWKAEKISAHGKIGIGIATIDQQDLSTNRNGIYGITTSINGQPNFELEMNRFSFSETRYINQLIDYAHYKKKRTRITKLFVAPNNPLSIYKNTTKKGVIEIQEGLSYTIDIHIKDFHNNTIKITIPVEGKKTIPTSTNTTTEMPYTIQSTENFVHRDGLVSVFIPKGSVYENCAIGIETQGDTVYLHRDEIPLHKKMTIAFDIEKYTPADRKKLYVARVGSGDKKHHQRTYRKGNRISCRTRSFGTYSIFSDTTAPTIMPLNVAKNSWMDNEQFLKIKIDDQDTGIASYKATINGKYILMEYDYKTGMLIYDFNDKVINDTENNFKLIVLDKVGNNATFETIFFKKP